MEYIESKENFKLFMKNEGLANNTSNNYITWLEFIAKKGFPINKELKNNSEIIDFLKKTNNIEIIIRIKEIILILSLLLISIENSLLQNLI